ncbi:MAG: DUF2817 domain-containing protein [Sphingomonadaceae bacterium]
MTLVPADHAEARRAFLAAARQSGLALESHPLAGHPGLATDVARLGPAGAGRLLAILSGTHGNEGLAGSAIQRDTIQGLDALLAAHGGLPEDFALLFVHAVNPWGMANLRRQNAGNVDLNRNFRDWSVAPPSRPVYRELHPFLVPQEWTAASEADFLSRAGALLERHGEAWLQARLTEGQYEVPDGLYWGGDGPAAETLALAAILSRHLQGAREALLIDCHTGMGAWGDWLVIAGTAADTPEGQWLANSFSPQRIHFLASGGEAHGGRWPTTEGKMTGGIAAAHPHIRIRSFSLEFGTHDGRTVFLAERREHWAWARLGPDHPERIAAAAALQRLMVPDDPVWQQRLLAGARACIADGLRALAGEGKAR